MQMNHADIPEDEFYSKQVWRTSSRQITAFVRRESTDLKAVLQLFGDELGPNPQHYAQALGAGMVAVSSEYHPPEGFTGVLEEQDPKVVFTFRRPEKGVNPIIRLV